MEGIIFGLGLSLHVGFNDNYNAVHPYVEYQLGNLRAGAFYNSENTVSTYGGVNFSLTNNFSIDAGIATGYEKLSADQTYDLTPYAKLNYRLDENTSFFAMPGAELSEDETETNYGVVSGITFNF